MAMVNGDYSPPVTIAHESISPGHKRNRSQSQDPANKRLKTESGLEDLELEAALAQATTNATLPAAHALPPREPIHESAPPQNQPIHAEVRTIIYDPNTYMWVMSLPILENLSIQILSTLAQGPCSETIHIVTSPDSLHGQAYSTLKSLFDQTKKIYSKDENFLSADVLNFTDEKHRSIIRITNMATFVSGVFGGQDVGFYELNNYFIDTFTPEGEPMNKTACSLHINLKTQMYLSACGEEGNDQTKEEILDDLFPVDLNQTLLKRHPQQDLSESEKNFLDSCRQRKELLLSARTDAESIQALSEDYPWEQYLQDLSVHLNQEYETLLGPYMKRHALTTLAARGANTNQIQAREPFHDRVELLASADSAAQMAFRDIVARQSSQQQNGASSHHQHSGPHSSHSGGFQPSYGGSNIPYHTQTAPTQVLYNQARQAALAKSTPGTNRQTGPPSQRRPWSTEEENALMAGLDQVRGPHWSQILALYGEKGSQSQILADRNQVQLKDKARNLKLFFLKSNIEVPYYLQSVTGELKTRAPGQAARKEAEERSRLEQTEAQAHFDGIMTLGRGLQEQTPEQNGVASQASPDNSQCRRQESPEEFHVTEPTTQLQSQPSAQSQPQPTTHQPQPQQQSQQSQQSQQVSDDEQLRQQLLAANASAGGHFQRHESTMQHNGFENRAM
ncbi:hypothetical protein HYFRA_00002392 [Hymenoscyphus fraxineus]|uniref:HTH myb-type domain-containing protein n=1 Tax=Hymenoscyphus fraxineus TaxID=746836 RepID=A0A9N9LAV5_9HELO|nr:hypothetical protein HYFRA_00002392 [Hymenoscyphus fraxineus]